MKARRERLIHPWTQNPAGADPKQFRNYDLPRKWARLRRRRESARRRRANDPERVRAIARESHKRNRPERLASMRAYYRNHRTERRLYLLAYYRDNQEAMVQHQRDYRAKHADELNAKKRARYASDMKCRESMITSAKKRWNDGYGAARNAARRQRYATDPEYRAQCVEQARARRAKKRQQREDGAA